MAVKIEMERPTIEFDMGGVPVTADVSDAALKEMLEIEDSPEYKQADKELERLRKLDDEDINKEVFDELLNKAVHAYGKSYEPIFGDDAFREVYENSKSIVSTVQAFDTAMDHINKYYEEKKNKRSNQYRKRKKK